MKRRHKGTVRRSLHQFSPSKQKCGHQKHDSQKADHNSLCQNKTQILSNGKTHQHQNDESHNCSSPAGKNRGHGASQRICQSRFRFQSLILFLYKGMQQEYGIVHGDSQLQNRRHAERQK